VTAMQRMKRWLSPLQGTPLHPQWLVLSEAENTRRVLAQTARGVVLDIGCGDRWLEPCLKHSTRYVGLDFPATVSKGYAGHPDVFGDGQRLPFASGSFDSLVLLDVLEHMPTPSAAMTESHRVLKPGGVLVVQVPFLYPLHDEPDDFQRWTEHGLRALFAAHHFNISNMTRLGHPLETAAALFAIALANSLLDAGRKMRPALLLAPLLMAAIPLVNLSGWVLARILPASSIMPMGYRVIAHKSP
jgi:SAM-dependent methyltransferase